MVDIKGLDKAAVLAALYNGTRAQGFGVLHDLRRKMTVEEARQQIEKGDDLGNRLKEIPNMVVVGRDRMYFDYVLGKPIKVDLGKDEFDPYLYDRDAGPGAAQRVIDELRTS